MKKILMSLLFVAFGATSVMAQGSFYLKPMVGGTLSTLTDNDDAKFKFGIVGGAELGYQAAEQVDLTAGLLVAMQGCKFKDDVYEKDMSSSLTYLNIPIMANYYIVPGLAIKAGIQPGFMLSYKKKWTDTDTGVDMDITSKDGLKQFDFSIPLGLSYEISDFVIDARYNLGLTKISKNDINKSKNSVIMLTVGYKIPF